MAWAWITLHSFPLGAVIISPVSNTAWTHKSRRKKWISLCPHETPFGSYWSRKNIKISLGREGEDENCLQLRSFCGTSKKRLALLNNRHLFGGAVYHVVNADKRVFFRSHIERISLNVSAFRDSCSVHIYKIECFSISKHCVLESSSLLSHCYVTSETRNLCLHQSSPIHSSSRTSGQSIYRHCNTNTRPRHSS